MLLEARGVTKAFGSFKAVNDASVGVREGEVLGLIGWKGPIVGQDGKELIAAGAVADDKFLSGVNFYVKGVDGKVPGDKK